MHRSSLIFALVICSASSSLASYNLNTPEGRAIHRQIQQMQLQQMNSNHQVPQKSQRMRPASFAPLKSARPTKQKN